MDYVALKISHIVLALVSVGGFVLRWSWKWMNSPLATHRVTRILPHVLDTLFLSSGIALAVMLHINPLVQHWLTAKLVGMVAYIALAWVAYKRVERPVLRMLFFIASLAVFAWVLSIARFKSPAGFLHPLLT